jgi:hypothetical protein
VTGLESEFELKNWRDIAVDSLEAAKELKESGRVRSSLSRAYYSAYALITGELQGAGHTVSAGDRANPAHEQLVVMARNNLDGAQFDAAVRSRIASGLRSLRQLRVAADYDPESTLSAEDALFAVRELSRIHRLLRS